MYIESPAAALVSAAPLLTRGERMLLINQAVSGFAVQGGAIVRRKPLATLDELRAYTCAARGRRGAKQIRTLLTYAVENTASPAEARVAAILCLPACWGGYGLPLPEANAPVEVRVDGGASATRYVDLLWRRWMLVLEYDSDEFHVGAEKIGLDSDRRTALQDAGYTVVTLTNLQFKSQAKFEGLARVLCNAMGRSFAPDVEGFAKRNAQLRSEMRSTRVFGV
ncbi:MAG: hypothetical protein Q4B77_07270 [Coriobacteriaceae bacterium]|nr:hypothetical protein [Coriobacteriaceae bacterium]